VKFGRRKSLYADFEDSDLVTQNVDAVTGPVNVALVITYVQALKVLSQK